MGLTSTAFPAHPGDVAVLTVPEFTSDLDLNAGASFDVVCRRFEGDANRALVWFIRFRALADWRARTDIAAWLRLEPQRAENACRLAASFALNQDWEFDAERFRLALERVGRTLPFPR